MRHEFPELLGTIMSNFKQDLQNAEEVGKEVFSDYQKNQKLDNSDLQKAGKAAEQLVSDFEGQGGESSGAVGKALGKFSQTDIGRKIEGEVAKQTIKNEAKNALAQGDLGSVAGEVSSFLKK